MDTAGRASRAAARRATIVLHRGRLQRTEEDLHPIAGAEAISLVAQLTRESWAESGLPMPTYDRAQIPCRFVPGRSR